MFEETVPLKADKAYVELKKLLLKEKCRIVAEENPHRVEVEQGSLWRPSPKGVKKRVNFYLIREEAKGETRVISRSSLTLDWI